MCITSIDLSFRVVLTTLLEINQVDDSCIMNHTKSTKSFGYFGPIRIEYAIVFSLNS